MFLHKGLHFRSIQDMLGYALIDDSYAVHSEEFTNGSFECSNEYSSQVLRRTHDEYISSHEEIDFEHFFFDHLA